MFLLHLGMKSILLILLVAFTSCVSSESSPVANADTTVQKDSTVTSEPTAQNDALPPTDTSVVQDGVIVENTADTFQSEKPKAAPATQTAAKPAVKKYENKRFKEVTIRKMAANKYLVRGKAQVWETNFSWRLLQGGKEVQTGNETTDAGAPAWGNFAFVVTVKYQYHKAPLQIVLYEVSANDGSPQHLLTIPLLK